MPHEQDRVMFLFIFGGMFQFIFANIPCYEDELHHNYNGLVYEEII